MANGSDSHRELGKNREPKSGFLRPQQTLGVGTGYSFVAPSASTTLSFAADPSNTTNCGAALADVTLTETAATGAQCKNGRWQTMHEPDGTAFKNQGDCVNFYATSGDTPIGS